MSGSSKKLKALIRSSFEFDSLRSKSEQARADVEELDLKTAE